MEAPIAAFVRYVPWLTDEDSLRRLFRNAHLCEPNGFMSGFRSCQMQLAGITIEGHMAQLGGVLSCFKKATMIQWTKNVEGKIS